MKRLAVLTSIVLSVLCVLYSSDLVVSQDRPKDAAKDRPKGKKKAPGGIDMEAMMKRWAEVGTPGKGHARLEPLIGKWEYTMKMWMEPGGPPNETKGTTELKWIMGKRFVQAQSNGTLFNIPYEGLWILGYDNFRKKYHTYYLDSTGTASYTGQGKTTPDGKAIAMFGTMDEWMTGEHDLPVKYLIRFGDKKTWSFEIHDLSLGEGKSKTMEIVYKRKK